MKKGMYYLTFFAVFVIAFILFSIIFLSILSAFPDRPRVQGLFGSLDRLDIPFLRAFVIVGNQILQSPTCTFLSDTNLYNVPVISRPTLFSAITDPVFSTSVTRVTDPSMGVSLPGTTLGLRHEYNRLVALNSDNTLMVVFEVRTANGGWYEVRNVSDGSLVYTIPRDGIDPTVMWHRTDPNLIFYRYGNGVRTFNASNGQVTTIMQFPAYEFTSTKEEGVQSDDWRYYAFIGYNPSNVSKNWSIADLVVADLQTQTILATIPDEPSLPDWIGMSPSGNYVVAMFTDSRGTVLYNRTLSFIRQLHPYASHDDFAYDENGDEVLVYYAVTGAQTNEFIDPTHLGGRAGIASVRLRDGYKKLVMDNNFAWSMHISGIASRQHPGWALIETYTTTGASQTRLGREIFWLNLSGVAGQNSFETSGGVKRIAHHHSDQNLTCNGGEKDYWAEPHAVPSWDGNNVFFSSIWDAPGCTRYDAYIVNGSWWCSSGAPPPSCNDVDLDGYNVTAGGVCGPVADCNDGNSAINPAATELCSDGVDNNCNNLIDATDPVCVVPSGLLGWWKFEEGTGATASDSSGNNNALNLTNSPAWVIGKQGYGLQFNGINNYLQSNSNSFNLVNNFTISFWLKRANNKTALGGAEGLIVHWYLSAASFTHYYVSLDTIGTSAGVSFSVSNGTDLDKLQTNNSQIISDTNWHHVAIAWDSANTFNSMRIYQDGVLIQNKSNKFTNIWSQSGRLLGIGAEAQSPRFFYNGSLDDLMIFGKALSSQEIFDIYNGNFSLCTDSDLDGYNLTAGGICGAFADCNDVNININPSATELCGNGIDENCDNVDALCTPSSDSGTTSSGGGGGGGAKPIAKPATNETILIPEIEHVELLEGGTSSVEVDTDEKIIIDVYGNSYELLFVITDAGVIVKAFNGDYLIPLNEITSVSIGSKEMFMAVESFGEDKANVVMGLNEGLVNQEISKNVEQARLDKIRSGVLYFMIILVVLVIAILVVAVTIMHLLRKRK